MRLNVCGLTFSAMNVHYPCNAPTACFGARLMLCALMYHFPCWVSIWAASDELGFGHQRYVGDDSRSADIRVCDGLNPGRDNYGNMEWSCGLPGTQSLLWHAVHYCSS